MARDESGGRAIWLTNIVRAATDSKWICEEHPDRPWPHDDCSLAKAMPNSRHEVIPEAGHFGPVTHTRDVNARVIAQITAQG